ncbi:hypothetical protein [Gelidibacter salicanalis]|uniref:Lipoprotein n=1 Tax=Gelidibacter salicanalis TaxID=291193 RepID=A0A934KS13_9FLAO|nr:hypothetical protein [Gelidibacter salicanalis]MBJ7879717.1 hypothetical protein [Gelidibacter salicanalis]
MKKIIFAVFILNLIIISCSKDDMNDEFYDATVLGKGLDCGNLFLIKFNRELPGFPVYDLENIYYENNLPDTFKIEGKKIKVKVRAPKNDEAVACTTLGTGYPHVYIIEVK